MLMAATMMMMNERGENKGDGDRVGGFLGKDGKAVSISSAMVATLSNSRQDVGAGVFVSVSHRRTAVEARTRSKACQRHLRFFGKPDSGRSGCPVPCLRSSRLSQIRSNWNPIKAFSESLGRFARRRTPVVVSRMCANRTGMPGLAVKRWSVRYPPGSVHPEPDAIRSVCIPASSGRARWTKRTGRPRSGRGRSSPDRWCGHR